jgi:medium-chain acyl-[acyl-carrier-protein] hydrolase
VTAWLQASAVDRPAARVCCLPRAGGSARDFDGWDCALGPQVEVCAVQFPGRLNRFLEPAATSLVDASVAIAAELADRTDLPMVIFGDCMGALIAFEVVRELRRKYGFVPEALVVASYLPPHEIRTTRPYHDAPPDDLRARLAEVGGVAPEMLADDELFELMLPTLRADFSLFETYEYRPEEALSSDIIAIVGSADPYVSSASLAGWQQHTSGTFEIREFPGGHFFLRDSPPALEMVRQTALG